MSYTTDNIFFRQGVRPELFTVSSGAYYSSQSFGSGATPQVSYNSITAQYGANVIYNDGSIVTTFEAETSSMYRKSDNFVFFYVDIDIYTGGTSPLGGTATGSELRIRNLSPINNILGSTGQNVYPQVFSRSYPQSLVNSLTFREIQIYENYTYNDHMAWRPVQFYSNNIIGISTGQSFDIGARLLSDDTFALYFNVFDEYKTHGSVNVPITYDVFSTLFGTGNMGSIVKIALSGTYFCT